MCSILIALPRTSLYTVSSERWAICCSAILVVFGHVLSLCG